MLSKENHKFSNAKYGAFYKDMTCFWKLKSMKGERGTLCYSRLKKHDKKTTCMALAQSLIQITKGKKAQENSREQVSYQIPCGIKGRSTILWYKNVTLENGSPVKVALSFQRAAGIHGTHVEWLTVSCTSSFRRLVTLFWPVWVPEHVFTGPHTMGEA